MELKLYNKIKKERNELYWPLYFNTDVLILYKYKDEYDINNRKIEHNGELIFSKFFLSSMGDQVIITQKDFNLLPDKEKKYWIFFKESPNSDISETMFKNIYLGQWAENDNITNLREILWNFPKIKLENKELDIWKQPKSKNPHNINDLYYVVSGSKSEWANEILTLDKNIIDGFQVKNLKKIVNKLNNNKNLKNYSEDGNKEINEKLENGSINLLGKCLKLENIDEKTVKKIIAPLRTLRKYRSEIVVHNKYDFPNEDLRINFKTLIEQCNTSLSLLSNLISNKEILYFKR